MDTNAKHILLVEDDVAIARLMTIHLQRAGYLLTVCGDGLDAQDLLAKNHYDGVVLDRMLPGRRGLDVLRWIRGREAIETIPVLMVTALTMAGERVRGLNEGADDYLGKPFEPDELVARVAALLRRSRSLKTATFDAKAIQLNPNTMEAMINGQVVKLRLLEFKLLQTMMAKPGFVFSREALLDKVWGIDTFVDERTVDVTIKRLRKELARFGQNENIETVRGLGYRYREKN